MVSVINAALERNLVSLEYNQDDVQSARVDFDFTLPNGMQCRGCLNEARHGEVSFAVCVNLKAGEKPAMDSSLKSCDATASGWLERKDGQWLQCEHRGYGHFSCRRTLLMQLAELEVEPIGYSDRGRFYL